MIGLVHLGHWSEVNHASFEQEHDLVGDFPHQVETLLVLCVCTVPLQGQPLPGQDIPSCLVNFGRFPTNTFDSQASYPHVTAQHVSKDNNKQTYELASRGYHAQNCGQGRITGSRDTAAVAVLVIAHVVRKRSKQEWFDAADAS